MSTESVVVSTSSNRATLVQASPQNPVLAFNSDTVNNIYQSEQDSFNIGQTNVVILRPLASIVLITDTYFATNGVPGIILETFPSISITPSPVDVAVSLIAAGLATSANQGLANLVAQGISNITSSLAPGNPSLHSQVANSFFTNPATGNADISGWFNRFANGAFTAAGINGATLPVGSGQTNGFSFVSTGGGALAQIQYGGGQNFSCSPGDIIPVHFWVNAAQTTSAAFVGAAFYTAAGAFISTLQVNTNIITANQWQKISNEFIAPPTAAICGPVFGLQPLTNGQSFFGCAAISYNANTQGTLPGDHAQAIANTGINGNLPTLLDTEVLNNTAGAWGPFTTALPACGSYLIAITTTTLADPSCSDFTVSHLDASGNVVHQDFFGAVPGGAWPGSGFIGFPLTMTGPVLLRGNIYGTTIQISGNKAAAAFANAITGSAGLTMSGFTYRLYTLPYNVPDTMPKMSTGSASLATSNGLGPGNLLQAYVAQPFAAAGSVESVVTPYAGPAKLFARHATAGGTVQLLGYSVASGAANKVWTAVFDIAVGAGGDVTVFPVALPACLVVLFNSITAAGTTNVSLVGDVSV